MRVPRSRPRQASGDAVGLHLHLGAHLLERRHVEVDGAAPDAVAADEGHEGLVGPMEQGAEQQDRDAVEPGELERHAGGRLGHGDHGDGVALDHHLEPDRPEDVGGDAHIAHVGGIGDGGGGVGQEARPPCAW